MTNKTPKKKPAIKPAATRERVVYEVKGPQGTKQVDVTTTAELKTVLAQLLALDLYSAQGLAHLVHNERVTVTGPGWAVKRLGVLAFVPDSATQKAPQPKTDQGQEAGEVPAPTPANPVDFYQGQPEGESRQGVTNSISVL